MDKLGGDLLYEAERLLQEGNRQAAYPLLAEYLQLHPNSARGWWMLSLAVTDLKQKIECIERVLQIDKNYTPARDRLSKLKERLAGESPALSMRKDSSPIRETRLPVPSPAPVKTDATPHPRRPARSATPVIKSNKSLQLAILSVMACTAVGIFGFLGAMILQGQTLAPANSSPGQATPMFTPTQFLLPPTWTPTPAATDILAQAPVSTVQAPETPVSIDTPTEFQIPESSIGPVTGFYAPDFSLKEVNTNSQVSLSDYRGKAILIYFWATWCPICKSEVSSVQHIYQAYQGQGLVVLAIDVGESAGKARDYRDAHGLSFPILNDSEESVFRKYNATGVPTHFFVDANGKITYIGIGYIDAYKLNLKVQAIVDSISD